MLGPVDDAYITCRYAANLAAGNGIVFNPGEVVEGCTAFGMMVLLALFAKLGVSNLIHVAQALCILSWAIACTVTVGLMRRGRQGSLTGMEGFGIAFLVGCLSPLVWAYAGMEAPVVAALWIGAVALHFREEDRGSLPIFSALLTVFAGLMRPDGILIAVVIALSMLAPPSPRRFGRTCLYSALVLGLFGGYWLWRWYYFGYPLPNTFYAKVGSSSMRLFLFGGFYVGKGMVALVLPLITLLFVPRFFTQRKRVSRRLLVYAGVCGLHSLYLMSVGGDFFPMQRFFIPMLAFWVLMLVELKRLAPAKPRTGKGKEVKQPVMVQVWIKAVAAIILINIPCAMVQMQLFKHVYLVGITEQWSKLGTYFERDLPEDAMIAAIPIGALGYRSDRYILDMLGLIDLHIAHRDMKTGRGVIGHEKYDTQYVMLRRPNLILNWPMFVRPVVADLIDWNANNRLSPAQSSMLKAIRGVGGYATRAIPMGEDHYVIASVRVDLVDKLPYAKWRPIPVAVERLLFLEAKEMRALAKTFGRGIFKGDLRRAIEQIRRPTVPQKTLF